jgi:hypothetical protein
MSALGGVVKLSIDSGVEQPVVALVYPALGAGLFACLGAGFEMCTGQSWISGKIPDLYGTQLRVGV